MVLRSYIFTSFMTTCLYFFYHNTFYIVDKFAFYATIHLLIKVSLCCIINSAAAFFDAVIISPVVGAR